MSEDTNDNLTPPPSPTTNVEASAFDKSSADKSDGQAGQEKPNFISGLLAKARERIQFNKTKKLNKIIELAKKRERITNSMVCKELRISDSTAVRYLNLLEKQGKLVQVGKTGRDAFYQVVE